MTNQIRFQLAGTGAGSASFLAPPRLALVVIFLWFGGMKFAAHEVGDIGLFMNYRSYVIGAIEISTAAVRRVRLQGDTASSIVGHRLIPIGAA
jgi:hypothetical protein